MSDGNSQRRRVSPRRLNMTIGVGVAAAVLVVAVVLAGPFLRLPSNYGGGGPSGSPDGSTPVPSAEASAICEFFADGGPETLITTPATIPAMAFPETPSAESPEAAAEAMAEAMAAPIEATNQFAERVSGYERDDVLALAATMAEFAAALDEAARADPDTADWAAINEELSLAREPLYGEHGPEAFYVKYGPPCGQPLPVVDCGPLDQATCDATVAEIAAGELEGPYAPPTPMPLTRVNLWGPPSCLSHLVVWLGGFGVQADNDFCGDDPAPTPTAIVGSPDVGVPYQVALHDCTVDFPLGDTWWRFENAGPTPGPIIPDTVGTVQAVVTLTSPDTAILRTADGSEHVLIRVDEPIEASCY